MDASNIFKPALSKENYSIGATTLAEYRKFIEKDSALDRRFQSLSRAPSVVDTILILRHKAKYEEHHNVKFTDKSLTAAAKLATRYVTGKHLPDKAIVQLMKQMLALEWNR